MYHDDSFVIRSGDVLPPHLLRGAALGNRCCASKLRNVCKTALESEGHDVRLGQEAIHSGFCRLVDGYGKDLADRAEVLLEFRFLGPPPQRCFHLLTRACMSPKSQVYIRCEWVESGASVTIESLAFPSWSDWGPGSVALPPPSPRLISPHRTNLPSPCSEFHHCGKFFVCRMFFPRCRI